MPVYDELLRCQQNFFYFVENYVKISHPKTGLVPFPIHDYQKRFFHALEKNRFNIAVKFRQGGFTTFSVIYALWLAMFHEDERVFVGSTTANQAKHIKKIVDQVLLHLPDKMHPRTSTNTENVIKFPTTGSVMSFNCLEAARGRAITFLIIEEAAFIKNMEQKWKTVYPSINHGRALVISTTNGAGNWFYDIYTDDNDFKVFESNYLEHPDYTPEKLELLRKYLGEKAFQQEVLGNFVGDGVPTGPKTVGDLISDIQDISNQHRFSKEEKFTLHLAAAELQKLIG